MVSPSKYNNIAAVYLQIAFRDRNGYPMGQETDPDNVVAGTTTAAYLVDGLVDLVPASPTFPVVTNQGGQKIISKTYLPATDYGTPTFTLSQRDETLDAYIKKFSVDTTYNTTRVLRGGNVSQLQFPDFVVIFSIKITESATGAELWDNYIYPNAKIINTADAGAAQITGDVTNPNPLTYALQLALASRNADGTLLSAQNMALNNNQDAVLYQRATNPLGLTTYVDDNATGTFILGYRPVNTDATGSAQNNITVNGVQTAVTSVSVTTGVVTQTAPEASGAIVVATTETNFVAI